MENETVIVKRICITKLYKIYNYCIDFNRDISFLHGENGSGKTTIINILHSILSGSFISLLEYDFDEISVSYIHTESQNEIKIKNTPTDYLVSFQEEKSFKIEKDFLHYLSDERRFAPRTRFDKVISFQDQIRNFFHCIYLPLNRVNQYTVFDQFRSILLDPTLSPQEYRRMKRLQNEQSENGVSDEMLSRAIDLLKKCLDEINLIKLENYKKFSSDLALIGFDRIKPTTNFNVKLKNDITLIDSILKTYVKGSEIIGKEQDPEEIKAFRDEYVSLVSSYKKQEKNKQNTSELIKLIVMSHDFDRYMKIAELIEKFNIRDKQICEKKELFVKIIDQFLNFSPSTGKKVSILDNNEIEFLRTYNGEVVRIRPDKLSSGEKQIFVFFTYLIFEVPNSGGVFIVDEPELSLHLNWQELLVESIQEVNQNIQVIFATHSPEIIGSRRNKQILVSAQNDLLLGQSYGK